MGFLAQNLAKAAAETDGINQKNMAKEQAYFRLDMPFRRWLQNIEPEQDNMDEICTMWWEEEKTIIRKLGEELVNQSGPQAFVGRVKADGRTNNIYRYCAAEAYNQFLYKTSSREILLKRGR